MATKKKTKRFVLLSPDGIPIHPTNSYTHSRKMVVDFRKWASRFKKQGYYSSVREGRIPLYEGKRYLLTYLFESCTLVEEKDKYKMGLA
jgi:hypothetical protein